MICAYCKSSCQNRIQRIEELLECISDAEYRAWLHVLLIRVYAQEGLVEVMERLIGEAFRRNTAVTTSGIMHSIISSYYHRGAIDQLAGSGVYQNNFDHSCIFQVFFFFLRYWVTLSRYCFKGVTKHSQYKQFMLLFQFSIFSP